MKIGSAGKPRFCSLTGYGASSNLTTIRLPSLPAQFESSLA
jgi:hypothetical protein